MSTQPALRWGFLSIATINSVMIEPLRRSPRNQLTAVASRSHVGRAVAVGRAGFDTLT
jgi:hypothetical protein